MRGSVSTREVVSFIGVGILGLISDVGSFNVGLLLGLRPTTASLIGFALGATVSFLGNRYLTFTDRHVPHVGKAYVVFVAINVVAVGIVQVVVWLGEMAALDVFWLNVVRLAAIAVVTVGRFFSYRRWVFLAADKTAGPPQSVGSGT